ncbi:MAG: hypothetical protein K2K57_13935 [Oscillospiraceae bacterium]|nr:hypothetical protein [Oscillospiraceae bacterium]
MQALPYVNYSLYELFLIFCFWSFIGWCVEVVDMTYETGEYQNRGFLNMPICPIEGFGMVMVILFFRGIKDMVIPLFLASTALCTGFELFMGWGMEKIFHARWWDYSHMKFNFKGYICLRNSLFFGAGCVFCVQLVEPLLENAIHSLPLKIGMGIVIIMAVLIAVDTVSSFSAAVNLSRRIRRLDEISRLLLAVSVKTGMKLASGTLRVKSNVETVTEKARDVKENVTEKVQDVKETVSEKARDVKENVTEKARDVKENVAEKVQDMNESNAARLERLQKEFESLLSERDEEAERLLKAFPRMKAGKYTEALNLLRSRLSRRKRNGKMPIPPDEAEEAKGE